MPWRRSSARARRCCSTAPSTCASAACCCRPSTASGCASLRRGDGARSPSAHDRRPGRAAGRFAVLAEHAGDHARGDHARRLRLRGRRAARADRRPAARACSTWSAAAGGSLALALTAGRNGPRQPVGAASPRARERADALLYEEIRAPPRRSAMAPTATTSSRCCSPPATRTAAPLSDAELRDELMTLLVAGHETTATALAWALERLVRNPDVLRAADRRAARGRGGGLPRRRRSRRRCGCGRSSPRWSAACRRRWSSAAWELPAGVNIAPSIYLLHRRADLYPDPLAFRPERFLGDDPPGTYEWIPFGGGVRRCLGASFALFEMKAVLRAALGSGCGCARRPAGARRGRRAARSPSRRRAAAGSSWTRPEPALPVIRLATVEDAGAARELVERAYGHYVERIGMRPGPMGDDYEARALAGQLHVIGDGALMPCSSSSRRPITS